MIILVNVSGKVWVFLQKLWMEMTMTLLSTCLLAYASTLGAVFTFKDDNAPCYHTYKVKDWKSSNIRTCGHFHWKKSEISRKCTTGKAFLRTSCTCPEQVHNLCRKCIGNYTLYFIQEIQHFSGKDYIVKLNCSSYVPGI